MSTPDIVVLYHKNCPDGTASAAVVWTELKNTATYIAVQYGDPVPDQVDGKHVLIVDFSFKADVIQGLRSRVKSLLILDHHATAEKDLADVTPIKVSSWNQWETLIRSEEGPSYPVQALFDMDRSGAGITWDFFNPLMPRPIVIDAVEDRDLWRFNHESTKPLMAGLLANQGVLGDGEGVEPFYYWAELMFNAGILDDLIRDGRVLIDQQTNFVHTLAKQAFRMWIGGFNVPVVNGPSFLASELGNLLAQGEPFAAVFSQGEDFRIYSLRSTDEGEDVGQIAASYGGGGHRNAAGFKEEGLWVERMQDDGEEEDEITDIQWSVATICEVIMEQSFDDPDVAEGYADALDLMLDDLLEEDFFGTEGQMDPRRTPKPSWVK